MHALDISLPLTPTTPPVPGDPPFVRRLLLNHEADGCEVAALSLSAHAGTHLDFPAHFVPGGKRAGDYPIDFFWKPALVVEAGPEFVLGPELLAGMTIAPGEAILFRTINSTQRRFCGPSFPDIFATVGESLAEELVRRRVGLVGIDALSIEPLTEPYLVHHRLLAADIVILEGLNLYAASAGRYRLCCLPLAMPEAEASPVRAVLFPQGTEGRDSPCDSDASHHNRAPGRDRENTHGTTG